MSRPIQARINLEALSENLSRVRSYAPNSKVLSVIKANAYGHGLIRAAGALVASDGFALLDLEDAVKLRQAGFDQKIVLLEGCFSGDELHAASRYSIDIVVHCVEQIDMLEQAKLERKMGIFAKCNTGMNRLGFRPSEFQAAISRLEKNANVSGIVLMTHFCCADGNEGVDGQMDVFRKFKLNHPRSLANSAALIRYPGTRGEWVRPGIMLYGSSPFAEKSAEELGLKPVMTLSSRIIAVQAIRAGDGVGYGPMFRAEKDMRIGIVACGYADGFPRHAPNGTPVLVQGRKSETVGRVSMDMLMVDISDIRDAGIGSDVVLWGEGNPVEQVAQACGTISYELLCAISPRVPVSYS